MSQKRLQLLQFGSSLQVMVPSDGLGFVSVTFAEQRTRNIEEDNWQKIGKRKTFNLLRH
jgi:hypothetical protein